MQLNYLKNNKNHNQNNNSGFTLIETMVAIFILTIALSAMLSLTANSIYSARYARNEITANYLMQEAVDYIRNDRDNAYHSVPLGAGWNDPFLSKYGDPNVGTNCFSVNGCYFEPADVTVNPTECFSGVCPLLSYDRTASVNNDFYTYHNSSSLPDSVFRRKIQMQINATNPDELDIVVTVDWHNAGSPRSRSLGISLLNWQKN